MATMRAARMYGYKQPLKLEEIPIPDVESSQVLVKVSGAGMCRTDFQLIDGYFHSNLPISPRSSRSPRPARSKTR
jgi:alcohol dehydrogenase, propanol-preferring